jgi:hypothetical protein
MDFKMLSLVLKPYGAFHHNITDERIAALVIVEKIG